MSTLGILVLEGSSGLMFACVMLLDWLGLLMSFSNVCALASMRFF